MFHRGIRLALIPLALLSLSPAVSSGAENLSVAVDLKIHAAPLHDGRISPMLYGGFVELLDDIVPGMRAEMLGDRGRRPSFVNRVWGRRDTNDVGVEEFVRLCRAVGTEPLVCVSLGDGVESARRIVEYLNGPAASEGGRKRAANGRAEPYGVKYWQAGNEIDAPGYAKSLVEFARAVRAADPGAVIISSFPTKELIDAAGAEIQIVCPHYYQADLDGVDADLRKIEGWIRDSAGSGRLRLGVTEWNIDAGNWGLGRGKLNTLGCALFEAPFLNVLHGTRILWPWPAART